MTVSPVVLLCGGKSSRLGVPKGLYEVSGKPWLVRQCEALQEVGSVPVVVLGYDSEKYLGQINFKNCLFALNPHPELGPFSSLICGLKKARLSFRQTQGCFVLPVDTPVPDREVWLSLEQRAGQSPLASVPVFEGSRGHPVFLSNVLIEKLCAAPLDAKEARLDFHLRALPKGACAPVPVSDSRVLVNLNTPEDFKRFHRL